MEEVDYTNLSSCISHNPKISKFEKARGLSETMFPFSERQVHIINMLAAIVQKFQIACSKPVGGDGYKNFFEESGIYSGQTDRQMDRQADGGKT